ncbi:translocation/assembly module TamB [Lujinxingia sediminis]|uniref:Translocation/assembly module TamB n=2 Tax=Lujinxingia sediminis TaxID=2480984 RepID=A0ABY0CSQ0_9DELT|nr:translocation/assembly module TamB [Lujinxingia sediminis]
MMKRWMIRIGKALGLILAIILGLVVLALLVVQIGAVRDPLVQRILASVNASLEGRIEVGEVNGPLLGGASIHDIAIYDGRSNLAAFIPEATLSYSLGSLIRGQLIVEDVTAERASLVVRTYPDGTLNWTTLTAPSDEEGQPLATPIFVERVSINDAMLAYVDQATESPDTPDLLGLRDTLLNALSEASASPAELRTIWLSAWNASPRLTDGAPAAPLSATLTALNAGVTASLYQGDILADLTRFEVNAGIDWLAGTHTITLGTSEVRISDNLTHVELGALHVGELLSLSALRATLISPEAPADTSPGETDQPTTDAPPVQDIFAHLDTLTLPAATLERFSGQSLGLPGDLRLSARIGGGDQIGALAELHLPDLAEPIRLSAQLADLTSETPRYLATLSTPRLDTTTLAPGLDLPQASTRLRAQVMGMGFDPKTLHAGLRARLDETRYDAYEASLTYLAGDLSEGDIRAQRLAALSPYLNLFASAHLDPEGRARAVVRTTADPDQAERAAELTGTPPVTADLDIDLDARFNPEQNDLLQAARSLDLDASWRFEGFDAFDIVINNSRGTLTADLERVEHANERYRARYTLDARAAGVRLDGMSLGTLRARDQGRIELQLPLEDPLASLTDLTNDLRIDLTNLRAQGNRLERASLRATSQKRPDAPRSLQSRLRLRASGIHTPDASVGSVESDLRATARLGSGTDPFESLRAFTLKGDLSAEALRAPASDATITSATLEFDLRGQLDAPLGDVRLQLHELTLGTDTFERADLHLAMASGDTARLDADLFRDATRRYDVGVTVQHRRRYTDLTLTELHLASDLTRWETTEESRIGFDGRRLTLDDVELNRQDGNQSIRAHGTFTPGRSQDLELGLRNLAPGQLAHDFHFDQLPDIGGHIDLALTLGGTASHPTVDLRTEASALTYEGEGPFNLSLAADYTDGQARIPEVVLSAYEHDILEMSATLPVTFDLQGNTSIHWKKDFRLNLNLAEITLRDFHQPLPILNEYGVEGDINGRVSWSGSLENPNLEVDLNAQGLQFTGEVNGEFVSLRSIDLATETTYSPPRGPRGGLNSRINLDWRSERIARVHASAALPLAQWLRSVTGYSDEELLWREAFLTLPMRLLVDIPDINLERIPLEQLRQADATGEGSILIDLDGTIARPTGRIDIGLQKLGWTHFRDMFIDLNARLGDGRLNVERLRFEWDGDEILVADGSLPLPVEDLLAGETLEDIPLNFRAQLRQLPISKLSAFNYEFARVRGDIAAYITLDGSLRAPRLEARAGLFDTRLGDGSTGTISMEVRGEDNLLNLDARLCRQYGDLLNMSAALPLNLDVIALASGANWQAPGELRVDVTSDPMELDKVLPTQLLSDLIEEPEGTLEADLKVRGDWQEPLIDGQFSLNQAAITLVPMGRRFVDIDADIALDNDTLDINTFVLNDGPSRASLTGSVGHERFIPDDVDLRLEANEFNLAGLAVDFPVYVSTTTTARGSLQGSPGTINVNIAGLEVVLTDNQEQGLHATELDPDIVILNGNNRNQTEDQTNASELANRDLSDPGAMNLRVNVKVDRDAWVRHPIGDVNIKADIVALLAGTNISLTGSAEAIRGDLEFLGRRFIVEPSEVVFTGATPPNPRLQLEATYELDRAITQSLGPPSEGDPRIIFRISGSADNPQLVLQSDPAMTDTEILFVLMTGRPPSRGDVGQDEGVANQALGAVSGLFFGLLQDQLAGTVPVDVLRLEPGDGGLQGGRLEFGKYITNDIFVSYRVQFGGEEDDATNIVRVEYHFLPRWMVELTYTDRNEGGANIFWDVY